MWTTVNKQSFKIALAKFICHILLTLAAVAIAGWLRASLQIGNNFNPNENYPTSWLAIQAAVIYPVVLLILSFYDPYRTFRAIDEYQILTVSSVVGGVLLGFFTLFIDRNTSRLLIVYFFIIQFALMFTFHSVLRIFRRINQSEIRVEPLPMNGYQRTMKRLLDLSISGLMLMLISPILGVIALAIKLDSDGPVFFKQQRVGENKRMFGMIKFRSMHSDAEARLHEVIRHTKDGKIESYKTAKDPRVTRTGRILRKTSLDELPQLINVLMGDMSLVGPRPELPMLVEQYEPWQNERLRVPQGMTGWWQVNGRSDKPMHQNVEHDIYYVRNYSLLLDLQILFKTIWVVLRGKGAY